MTIVSNFVLVKSNSACHKQLKRVFPKYANKILSWIVPINKGDRILYSIVLKQG